MGDTASGRGRTRMIMRPVRKTRESVPPEERETRASAERETPETDYHVFRDTAIRDEWHFRGDGKEAVDFFRSNSNYDELIRSMNGKDRTAFQDIWVPGHFMYGQMYNGFDSLDSSEKDAVRSYDKIIDQSVIREAFVVRRQATAEFLLGKGNKTPRSLEQLQALQGKTVTSTANMSTAAAGRGLAIGSPSSKSIEYVMKFPANTRGAGMWIGDTRINRFGVQQREFMTNRDIKFRIGQTTYNPSTRKYEVELIYEGRNEHDYGRSRR